MSPGSGPCAGGRRRRWGYYRATVRGSKPPAEYAELQQYWLSDLVLPTLYLHGADDGASGDHTRWVEPALPAGSRAEVVEGAGHFLQLDRPEEVARLIVEFVGDRSG
jgi:pimeloyl-ACP methyl ester carboxylesterase